MCDLVFAATRGAGRMSGFPKLWSRIAKDRLPADVTPRVLRHSFASLAGDLGYSEPTIAALVGHKGHTITSRYVHAADEIVRGHPSLHLPRHGKQHCVEQSLFLAAIRVEG
jgi:integrase